MADNNGDGVGETLQELGINYQRLESHEEDDNDEGTVEYLDFDMEVEVVPDSVEYLSDLIVPLKGTPQIQAPVPKSHRNNRALTNTGSKYKSVLRKQAAAAPKKASTSKTSKKPPSKRIKTAASNDTIANNVDGRSTEDAKYINGHGQAKPNTRISNSIGNWHNNTQNNESQVKSSEDSVDLFFQSMAQTVLNLPLQIQAKIKMDICKVITMAEIKYCTSDVVEDYNKPNAT